jgi:hypothetical protein
VFGRELESAFYCTGRGDVFRPTSLGCIHVSLRTKYDCVGGVRGSEMLILCGSLVKSAKMC